MYHFRLNCGVDFANLNVDQLCPKLLSIFLFLLRVWWVPECGKYYITLAQRIVHMYVPAKLTLRNYYIIYTI